MQPTWKTLTNPAAKSSSKVLGLSTWYLENTTYQTDLINSTSSLYFCVQIRLRAETKSELITTLMTILTDALHQLK